MAMIMRMVKLPDGRLKVLIQGLAKAKIIDYLQRDPMLHGPDGASFLNSKPPR